MYFLLLFFIAFVLFSFITTNWPVKLYHHYLLKKLGMVLDCEPQKNGLTLSSVYSQIITVYQGRELRIRFVEGAMGALKAKLGLEIRLKALSPVVLGIYQKMSRQQEWGDFKRFRTGDPLLDSQWFILTDNLQAAAEFWGKSKLPELLTANQVGLDQIQVNHDEIIACLRRFQSAKEVIAFLDRLNAGIPRERVE